uniref:RAP domain-containing protein n=1 Tax=Chromera velia CCMP2878 TaxID=1169474 RepID=A0A0G4H4L1_9ALVE|eukprot:Cvel_24639.t1-p1 / transcript=Cvel_24639.t1 / gene=Cvel_24639 / organism=Chromera_velia_CCMP2878 / gene_product=hypothetical protein / transcript_product=hypothetical protein / location=Cvel_scaffold2691:14478-16786(+) / protein_length=383 / sequence_SO=supercontig / SO=protein_coding / is_pseudo=false
MLQRRLLSRGVSLVLQRGPLPASPVAVSSYGSLHRNFSFLSKPLLQAAEAAPAETAKDSPSVTPPAAAAAAGKTSPMPSLWEGEQEILTPEQQKQKEELIRELTRRLSGPLADENGNVPTGKDRPTAIEVDGPSHFYANSTKYTAYTKLKHRLLTRMGYRVLHVPYFEWRKLRGAREREEYMKRKLQEEPTEWLDPEDEKYYTQRMDYIAEQQVKLQLEWEKQQGGEGKETGRGEGDATLQASAKEGMAETETVSSQPPLGDPPRFSSSPSSPPRTPMESLEKEREAGGGSYSTATATPPLHGSPPPHSNANLATPPPPPRRHPPSPPRPPPGMRAGGGGSPVPPPGTRPAGGGPAVPPPRTSANQVGSGAPVPPPPPPSSRR